MRIALVLTVVLAFSLTGCTPEEPSVLPQPAPSSTPIFASDEEALAAAEEAYGAYLAVVDEIYARGGANSSPIDSVASSEIAEREKVAFEEAAALGQMGTGRTAFDTMSLQWADLSGATMVQVVAVYVCEDFSDTDVLDAQGISIISQSRPTRWPLVVLFDATGEKSRPLIVSGIDDWTGEDFCETA